MGICQTAKSGPISNFLIILNLKSKLSRGHFYVKISWIQDCPSWYRPLGPQPRAVKFSKQNSFSVTKKAYAEIFSSIPCQITEIFGKKGWVFGPRPTALPATWGRKKNFKTWDFAKIVVKKISACSI